MQIGAINISDHDTTPRSISPVVISFSEETDTFNVSDGLLYLMKPLDYEIQNHYTLNVTASNGISEPWTRYTNKVINITVNDVNEPPIFINNQNPIIFREDETDVYNISVYDPDNGSNGNFNLTVYHSHTAVVFTLRGKTMVVEKPESK